jgi:DNA-directed RNA polymerase subunit M/transcription elongation factor TFIIS
MSIIKKRERTETNWVDELKEKYHSDVKKATLDKKWIIREKIKSYNFITKSAHDISFELLLDVEKNLDRNYAVKELDKYLNNIIMSSEIERGIFESVLINVSQQKLQHNIFYPNYFSELYNICRNLDLTDENIDNTTLLPSILNGEIHPHSVAFLSPQQMHPTRWKSFYQKKERETETINHTGAYKDYDNKCKNCGGVDFHSYEQQLRSADEPASKFIICIDCNYTVIQW